MKKVLQVIEDYIIHEYIKNREEESCHILYPTVFEPDKIKGEIVTTDLTTTVYYH